VFFIVGGTNVSVPLILTALGLFVAFLAIKFSAKFVGVYFLAKKYIPHGSTYTTLLMSTGLTFGTIASVFGLTAGYINQVQYSVLVGVVVATAVISLSSLKSGSCPSTLRMWLISPEVRMRRNESRTGSRCSSAYG
jgi:Kef-type K+ transport system membrane component KefB